MRYEAEIIRGVLEGLITREATMRRWRTRPFHFPTRVFSQNRAHSQDFENLHIELSGNGRAEMVGAFPKG
jgi:hypothetical protein